VHELSLCEAIAHKVQERAGGRPVRAVIVQIGYFRQVVPDAMLFSWEVLTSATELEGTSLEIEHVPAVVECRDCGAATELTSPALVCGAYNRPSVSRSAITLRIDAGESVCGRRCESVRDPTGSPDER
jgi:hydrogenase nickel incorporation protein HypA/HybF